MAEKLERVLDRHMALRHSIEDTEGLIAREGHIPGNWPREWRNGLYMPITQPHNARVRPGRTLSQRDDGGSLKYFGDPKEKPGILEVMKKTAKKRR